MNKEKIFLTILIALMWFSLQGGGDAQAQLLGPSQLINLEGSSTTGIVSTFSLCSG